MARGSLLVIACGALAHELVALKQANGWNHLEIQCLPAELHNRPERIPGAVRDKLEAARETHDRVFVAYGDCGTGGLLDRVLAEYGAERIPGAHCYQFFGGEAFDRLQDEEPGSFYLTDFLLRHFDRLIWRGMGIDRHPSLLSTYFGNYRRLVYLAQFEAPERIEQARAVAARLGLDFVYRHTGYGELRRSLSRFVV
ncbi:MAG: DUF1638 domain-containing protein [Candidatus Competibacterales bacterium]|nr:DUF1638 domain-containing protein [Candidatus Competibacterales bacterium]